MKEQPTYPAEDAAGVSLQGFGLVRPSQLLEPENTGANAGGDSKLGTLRELISVSNIMSFKEFVQKSNLTIQYQWKFSSSHVAFLYHSIVTLSRANSYVLCGNKGYRCFVLYFGTSAKSKGHFLRNMFVLTLSI